MDSNDAVLTLLQARDVIYMALARCFGDEPDQKTLDALVSLGFDEVCHVIDDEEGALSSALRSLTDVIRSSDLEELQSQYTVCFIGPKVIVPPYESVFVTGERLVFQASTLEVREAYSAEGFKAVKRGSEPDDHIATELDFLAKLASRAAEAWDHSDLPVCSRSLVASHEFLAKHLGNWIDDFTAEVEVAEDRCPFCAALSDFASAMIRNDMALLDELSDSISMDEGL